MKAILDTHAFLWLLLGDPRLSKPAIEAVRSADAVFWAPVNLWEIGIKLSKGGFGDLEIPHDWDRIFPQACRDHSIHELPLAPAHFRIIQDLPSYHRDPFDRMLVAQATAEQSALISKDKMIVPYDISIIW